MSCVSASGCVGMRNTFMLVPSWKVGTVKVVDGHVGVSWKASGGCENRVCLGWFLCCSLELVPFIRPWSANYIFGLKPDCDP